MVIHQCDRYHADQSDNIHVSPCHGVTVTSLSSSDTDQDTDRQLVTNIDIVSSSDGEHNEEKSVTLGMCNELTPCSDNILSRHSNSFQ